MLLVIWEQIVTFSIKNFSFVKYWSVQISTQKLYIYTSTIFGVVKSQEIWGKWKIILLLNIVNEPIPHWAHER